MKYCVILLSLVAVLGVIARKRPTIIGQFRGRDHGVSSGDVTVLNDRQIQIESFNYDGRSIDAWFYVGITSSVGRQVLPYGRIDDENGRFISAGAYSYRDIILTLPSDISIHDLKWLSMYCIVNDDNFGEVFFPKTLNVPKF